MSNVPGNADDSFEMFMDDTIASPVNDTPEPQEIPEVPAADEDIDLGWDSDPSQTPASAAEPTPKDDPKRFQYWQSQYSKLKNELEQVKPEYDELKTYAPIARYIQSNPQILQVLEQSLKGETPNGILPIQPQDTAPKDPMDSLQMPKRPEKPANYSAYEAQNDPESISAKYNESLISYQEQILDYYQKKDELREQKIQQETENAKKVQEQYKMMQGLSQELQFKHNLTPVETKEFIQQMSAPQSTSLDELVAFWKFKKQQTPQTPKPTNSPQAKPQVPPPLGIAGGASEPKETSPQDQFNLDLLRYAKGRF